MELDEFKDIWHYSLKHSGPEEKTAGHKINIPTQTINTLALLQQENTRWLKKAISQLPFVLIMLVFNLVFYLTLPATERVDHFKSGAILFLALLVFGALVVIVAYMQYHIFNIRRDEDMKTNLMRAIKRFHYLFTFVFPLTVPVGFVVLIVVIQYLSRAFHLEFTGSLVLLIGLVLTAITAALTYRYYRKTYFPWISQLKKSLEELLEEE